MIGRVSDEAVGASIAPTLRAIHADGGPWAHRLLVQLIGVVEHVRDRAPDPTDERRGVLVEALDRLAGNPLVPADGAPEERAAAALVAAVDRIDGDVDAVAVRTVLRPVLVAELDDELVSTMSLLDAFRGRVRDA